MRFGLKCHEKAQGTFALPTVPPYIFIRKVGKVLTRTAKPKTIKIIRFSHGSQLHYLWRWPQRAGRSVTYACEGILFGRLLGGSCCADFIEGASERRGADLGLLAGLDGTSWGSRALYSCHQNVPRTLVLNI